jgi:hypothetical protein
MSMAEIPNKTFGEELQDPSVLMDYIRSQFEAAYQKEYTSGQHAGNTHNGSFYKQMPIPSAGEHALVKNSTKIVLKPPFSTLIRGVEDSFIEIFSITLRGEDGHETAEYDGFFADQYLVRSFSRGRYGGYDLVSEDGVFSAEINEFDPISGYDYSRQGISAVEDEVNSAMRPIIRASELLALISGYNIVATND